MKYLIILFLLPFLTIASAQTQEIWTLERCIRYAIDNSLNVRNSQLTEQISEVDLRQAKQARLPNLNANLGVGLNFGRVINPATNLFETENTTFSRVGASSDVTLFEGGSISNAIRQADLNLQAAQEDTRQTQDNIALQVALSYLNVLFAEENLQNAKAKVDLSNQQLDQTDKMIAAGSIPQSDRYDVLAQIALDEQDVVKYQNDYQTNLLGLKQVMRLEPDYDLVLEKPDVSIEGMEAFEDFKLPAVYDAALSSQPQIKAQELRIHSAQLGESIARSALIPRLGLNGSIGTNYSDFSKQATGYESQLVPTPGVYINGESAQFEVQRDVATGLETIPFLTQYDNNLGYGVSLSLIVPIYNRNTSRAAISQAKLNTMQQQLTDEQIKQTLKSDIQNALAAARAAREALDAAQKSLDAADIAYSNAEKRFALGTLNNFDFISARNRLDAARVSHTIAKYDYLFRAKVIEYYLGRGLTLN